MGLKLACRDLGMNCSHVARGETMEQLADGARHGKEVHGYRDEQLNNPEMVAKIKAAVRRE